MFYIFKGFTMSEKIIRRIACRYHAWMMKESLKPPNTDMLLDRFQIINSYSEQICKWINKFRTGMSPRRQYNPHGREVYHGIICPGPYTDMMSKIIPRLSEKMSSTLEAAIKSTGDILDTTYRAVVPTSLQDTIYEIRAIFDSWDKVSYKNGILSVLIKDVVLEDGHQEVDFGDFNVTIDVSNPRQSFLILSVHCVESAGGYVHPHINGKILCTGEGEDMIQQALNTGRLEDFFRIVETTLRTYNDMSPYEELSQWYNPSHENQFFCEQCDVWRDDDSNMWCGGCDAEYCEYCSDNGMSCTSCHNWRCQSCYQECHMCMDQICDDCMTCCDHCGSGTCGGCTSSCVECCGIFCDDCTTSCHSCGDCTCESCKKNCDSCDQACCTECKRQQCDECGSQICDACSVHCDAHDRITCLACIDQHACATKKTNVSNISTDRSVL